MKNKTLFLSVFFCFFSLSILSAQGGQRLNIQQGEITLAELNATGGDVNIVNPGALKFTSKDAVTSTIPNQQCDGRLNQNCGWYKGFWIFGDGNYQKFEDDNSGMDVRSLNIRSYDYGRNGTFKPVVYLTEKYHNENPPEAARATLNINQAAPSGVITEITRNLTADQRLHIDYNHKPRVKYPVNFVLSYKNEGSAAHVLFYYNGLSTGVPSDLMTYGTSEKPAYFPDNYGPFNNSPDPSGAFNPAMSLTQGILAPLSARYRDVLAYNVRETLGAYTEGFTELRVFPVMNVKALNQLPNGRTPESPASFTAVLVGSSPLESNDPAYSKLMVKVKTLLGPDVPDNLSIGGQSNALFIRDIQTIELPLLESHDPNSLTVTDIRDMGNGKYRVYFRMIVCNQGEAPELQPSLNFYDLTGGHYAEKPILMGLSDIARIWSVAAPWKVTLNNFQISGSWDAGHPSCRELFFNMVTDLDGVQRLYQNNPRALRVCVDFSNGAGECSENDPLPQRAYQDDAGNYKKDEFSEKETTDTNSWWLWAFLFILLLLIIWYWYKRKED
ncbi:MAG: hypothetical protein JNJ57_15355 [Saprospiraceae bacterium]|nr:hypothetical protein [Saprospiraceae bacterium]